MRVSGIGNILGTYNAQKIAPIDSKRDIKKKDMVNISSAAKEYQIAKKELTQSPDVREDRVKVIKEQIESGTYNLNADEIADKIVKSMFDTKA